LLGPAGAGRRIRRHEGKSAEEAIVEPAVLRFRPIMMTTMAAIFAILPIALG
jgi:HAE1 family hydrophobic/amphiphilic exporter-1